MRARDQKTSVHPVWGDYNLESKNLIGPILGWLIIGMVDYWDGGLLGWSFLGWCFVLCVGFVEVRSIEKFGVLGCSDT